MLRIQRVVNRGVVLSLSGRIEPEDMLELQRLVSLETGSELIAFDLQDITMADRDAVKFLERCETEGIELRNCPAYIRDWIETERGGRSK
jgi:hypothetical protein